MRIAIVHPGMDCKGGSENVVAWLAEGLRRRGHAVTLVTDRFDPTLWPDEFVRHLEPVFLPELALRAPIRSKWLRRWAKIAFLARALRGFDWVVGQHFPTYTWSVSARRLVRGRWRVLWLCQEPLRRLYHPVTDRHVHAWESLTPPGIDNEHLCREMAMRVRARPRRLRRDARDRRWDRAAVLACDRVVATSRFTARHVREIFGAEATVCHNGLPLPDARPFCSGEYVALLTTLSRLKNAHNVVRAAHELVRRRGVRDLQLKIAGQGPERGVLEGMVSELGLAAHVGFLGPLRDAELPDFYHRARLVAYCPIDEPFGLVPLEALALRTPPVVSDHGGPAELIENGVTGLHANPLDPTSIADAIERLWRDPRRAHRLAEAGHAAVRKHHSLDAFVDRVEGVLAADAHRPAR
ncbi:MAG TPA: glycosyltransferase family 4 protein [Myxococcota bacterium]